MSAHGRRFAYNCVAQHIGALVVTSDAFFNSQFDRIVELAARHHVPTIYNGASIPSGRGAPGSHAFNGPNAGGRDTRGCVNVQ
jgi:hypothetical protein